MNKQRIISALLALALALSLIPAGFAVSPSERYDSRYQPNLDCGKYLGKNEDGVYTFEITIPDDGTPQPLPLTYMGDALGANIPSRYVGLLYDGPNAWHFYGHTPGICTLEYLENRWSSIGENVTTAIVYITVIPAEEYRAAGGMSAFLDSHAHRWSKDKYETEDYRITRTYQECLVCHVQRTISGSDPGITDPGTSTHTHQYVTKVVKEATCKSTGTSQEVCSICGAVRSGSTKTIAKTADHTWEDKTTPATCTREGKSWQQCSVCGKTQNVKTISNTEHHFVEGTVIRQPTVTQPGQRMDKCSVCGTVKYVELPKLEEGPLGAHISGSRAMSKLSQQEIRDLLKANPLTPQDNAFDQVPSISAPFSAGKVKDSVLQSALNRLNALRKIGGLPAVSLDASLTENAQYGAVIIAAMGSLSHNPPKQPGMSEAFYEQAYSACASSNLAAGRDLVGSIDLWMDDTGDQDVGALGHRRWQLNPAMGKIGFGFASSSSGYRQYASEKCFDSSAPAFDYDFIGWPSSGNFPGSLFRGAEAWSVSLNPGKYQAPSQSQVKVTLTRKADGRTWVSGTDLYFAVDPTGYGVKNCIIFRPSGIQKYEGVYTVKIDGLKTLGGKPITDFTYDVEFFDLDSTSGQKPDDKPDTPAFADVRSTEWYYDSVQQAYADGVIEGSSCDASTGVRMFNPNGTLTLAEFTTIVTRAFYSGEIGQRDDSQPWYTPYVTVADRHGLLQGAGVLNMNGPASRFQMAQIMLNILEDQGEPALSSDAVSRTAGQIADWNQVNASYRTAVATCYSLGLLKGNDGSGTFNGAASMRRCECATVYIRLRDHLKNRPAGDGDDYSESYKSGKYYAALKNVTLTGDYRRDIIAVAVSQLGYCESNSKDQLDGTKPGGGNCTEYGRYMGTNGTAWCSEFASWCLRQARVPTSLIQSSPSANIKTFAAPYHPWSDTVYAGGSYVPQAGDLILFAWSGVSHTQANLSHTGIVERVEWDGQRLVIHTIEGNANDNVMRCERRVTDPASGALYEGDIVYFVAPDY